MSGMPVTRIWIIRRGNGKLQVAPSPAHLAPEFTIRNLADADAEVVFDPKYVSPPRATIGPGAVQAFGVIAAGPAFFEYDVTLPRSGQYAEGGSKPGGIVDP